MTVLDFIIYAMVYLGSALMVYNIAGFIVYVRYVMKRARLEKRKILLYFPIALLVMFLVGYLAVGFFGHPDLIVSGILFGGSIFVFVMYLFLRGITKRILEQERLEAELMAAEQSSRDKTTFLSSVSHEMRTPLNVIIGLDTVALSDPEISDKTRDHLEKIGSSAQHLLGLINGILDINSIDEGKLAYNPAPFDLADALGQVNAIASALAERKGLEYKFTAQKTVSGKFVGDGMLIKKVLIEILDNAVKYTDAPGTVSFFADCAVNGDAAELRFTVKDTGVGMSEQFIPKLFDVFTQEDSGSTSRYGGSGLGLAVTKKMTDLMGGTITVESTKNVGSTFTVTIPLKKERTDGAAGAEEETDRDGSGCAIDNLEGCRILIVEDLAENAEIVADLLELEGAESEHAENGKVGVEMFAASPAGYYDAVLMDLRMPVMDGLTAAGEIRKLEHKDAATIPVIALTANAFDSDIKKSFAAGMDAHLAKPADAELLYKTLKTCIGRARAKKGVKGQ